MAVTIQTTPDERRRIEAGVLHLSRLGPRATTEAFLELAHPIDLFRVLEAYGRLTPELLRLVGGDRFSQRMAIVPDDRRFA